MRHLWIALAVMALGALEAEGVYAQAANPCGEKAGNPCAGKAENPCGEKAGPAMNPCFAKHGEVFRVNDEKKRDNVTFRSSAPLEDIVGTTNEVQGYLAFDPEKPQAGIRGEFRTPVESLVTGIPLRDEHLRGEAWLDAVHHPDIRYRIDGTSGVKLLKEGDGFKTWDMTLVGIFSLHGREQRMEVFARVTWLPESSKTRSRLPGDLLAGRARFNVRLADFGVKGFDGVVGSKVSDSIEINVSLVGSNAGADPSAPR